MWQMQVRLDKHDVTNMFGLDVTNTQVRLDKSDLLLGTGGTNWRGTSVCPAAMPALSWPCQCPYCAGLAPATANIQWTITARSYIVQYPILKHFTPWHADLFSEILSWLLAQPSRHTAIKTRRLLIQKRWMFTTVYSQVFIHTAE